MPQTREKKNFKHEKYVSFKSLSQFPSDLPKNIFIVMSVNSVFPFSHLFLSSLESNQCVSHQKYSFLSEESIQSEVCLSCISQ